jgi:hypothetical protein
MTHPTVSEMNMRELAAKCTPGPWDWHYFAGFSELFALIGGDGKDVLVSTEDGEGHCIVEFASPANAELIARLSPSTVLAVVEALEGAQMHLNINEPHPLAAYEKIKVVLKTLNRPADRNEGEGK